MAPKYTFEVLVTRLYILSVDEAIELALKFLYHLGS